MENLISVLILAIFASAASAQPTTKPAAVRRPTTKPVSAEQQLDNMLKQPANEPPPSRMLTPTEPPAPDKSTGSTTVAPGAPLINLMREGSYIVDRTGRLTRGADGQSAEFTFDADGRTMKDPPMAILPNLKLMQMENAVGASNRDLRFSVSGTVTEYKNRNYVLLERVVVEREN